MARLWANYILKVNRAQLKKRKVRKFKDMVTVDSTKEGVRFKEVSEEELSRIKAEIRQEATKEIWLGYLRSAFAFLGTLLIIWLVIEIFS